MRVSTSVGVSVFTRECPNLVVDLPVAACGSASVMVSPPSRVSVPIWSLTCPLRHAGQRQPRQGCWEHFTVCTPQKRTRAEVATFRDSFTSGPAEKSKAEHELRHMLGPLFTKFLSVLFRPSHYHTLHVSPLHDVVSLPNRYIFCHVSSRHKS